MENDILQQIYHKYTKKVYLYLYSLCRNHALAEDLMQETFIRALCAVELSEEEILPWLLRMYGHRKKVMGNKLLRYRRIRILTLRRRLTERIPFDENQYQAVYDDIERNGIRGYGAVVFATKEVLMDILEDSSVDGVYMMDSRLNLQ